MPRVSVVIPTFNRSDYVQKAIQSVFHQTYRDLEIIVCDDGSTDNTVETVKSMQIGSELPIKIEVLPFNLGASAARNKGVFLADGELIAFLDSDDIWKPHKLEKQVAFLDNNKEFIGVGCENEIVDKGGKQINTYRQSISLNYSNELFHILYKCYIVTSSFLVKKDALILAGLFDLRLKVSEDRDLWWRLPKIGRVGFLNEPLISYRMHDKRLSKSMAAVTGEAYIPAIIRSVSYWKDKLTKKEKRKIMSNAHLLVAHDAALAGAFFLSIKHAVKVISYRENLLKAIKIVLSGAINSIRFI